MSSDCDNKDAEDGQGTGKPETVLKTRAFEFITSGEKAPRGEARYRDPSNPFQTWSGRGKRPGWLLKYLDSGRQLAEFEIRLKEE